MNDQLTSHPSALRLLFTEDLYLVKEEEVLYRTNSGVDAKPTEEPILREVKIDKLKVEAIQPLVPMLDISLEKAPVQVVNQTEQTLASPPQTARLKEKEPTATPTFKYIGKNLREVLILVNDAENGVSTEEGNLLLRRLVNSVGLLNTDFALVNYALYTSAQFIELKQFFSAKVMFVFGVEPLQLGLTDLPKNTLNQYENTRVIFSSNLNDLAGDQETKKILWATLKQLVI